MATSANSRLGLIIVRWVSNFNLKLLTSESSAGQKLVSVWSPKIMIFFLQLHHDQCYQGILNAFDPLNNKSRIIKKDKCFIRIQQQITNNDESCMFYDNPTTNHE